MEEKLGKLTLALTKFLILFIGHIFAGFSISLNFCQKLCTKDVHGAPGVQVRSWSARSPGPKLERLATLVIFLFCLSFSPFFGKDSFGLTSSF